MTLEPSPGGAVFLFPGQVPSLSYAADLAAHDPGFSAALSGFAETAGRTPGLDGLGFRPRGEFESVADWLTQRGAHPVSALGAELAFAEFARTWGVGPDIVVGEGPGHLAALCAAGQLTEADALLLLAARLGADGEMAGDGQGGERHPLVPAPRIADAADRPALTAAPPRGGLYPTVARLLRDGHSTFVLTAPCPATARLLRPLFDDRRSASLEPPADAGFDRRGWLSLIARLINQGAQLDLAPERFAAGLARVRLPGYPFERRRHWLDDPGQPAAPPRPGPVSMADAGSEGGHSAPAEVRTLLRAVRWRPAPGGPRPLAPGPGSWVVFEDQAGVAGGLAERLSARGHQVTRVLAGAVPPAGQEAAVVSPLAEGDYRRLAGQLGQRAPGALHLVHAWSCDAPPPGEQDRGAVSLLLAIRALTGIGGHPLASLTALTAGAHEVTAGDADVSVAGALTWGVAKAAAQELPRVSCRAVDLAASQHQAPDWPDRLADELLACGEPEIALSAGQRLVPRLEAVPPTLAGSARPAGRPLKPGGVYLVTGACGGIGRELSCFLAARYAARLVLLGRAAGRGAQAFHQQLTRSGAEVLPVTADVCDAAAVASALTAAKRRFGSIDGVFHLAGKVEFATLTSREVPDFRAVLAPKVIGTQVLDAALAQEDLDFFVLFSSVAGVLGGAGRGDYVAANRFLDAFAHNRRRAGRRVQAIAWGTWRETGMAGRPALAGATEPSGMIALEPRRALSALPAAMSAGLPHIVVADFGGQAAVPLAAPPSGRPPARGPGPVTAAGPAATMTGYLRDSLAELLEQPAELIDEQARFFELGADSIQLVRLTELVAEGIGVELPGTFAFEHPTLAALAAALLASYPRECAGLLAPGQDRPEPLPAAPVPAPDTAARPADPADIAIIGMSGRFPGAGTLAQFWRNLADGVDSVTEVPPGRWPHGEVYDPDPAAPGKTYSNWGGFLESIDGFDPLFFRISPREAAAMDPQQRIFLEVAYEALESAGYAGDFPDRHRAGVFVAAEPSEYVRMREYDVYSAAGHDTSVVANRVSYALDLGGPSLSLDAACASSALAVHLAVQSLRTGECPVAIAGGVKLLLGPEQYVINAKARLLSPTGRCRAFDASADGYVHAEGAGAVVLKPLAAAQADGDPIRAVIKGSAAGHDGARKVGLSAPSVPGQAAVIRAAMAQARADPGEIGYVEAHGTGTAIGDPLEIRALTDVYREGTQAVGYCAIGSVKSNIGHAEIAAGIVGLIKTVLVLEHGQIPPTLHVSEPSPHIAWDESPFRLPLSATSWGVPSGPRRAAVSSFGFGGTNAHLVLEEAPPRAARPAELKPVLLALSARTASALRASAADLAAAVRAEASGDLRDIAFTLIAGRRQLAHRLALVVASRAELLEVLELLLASDDAAAAGDPRVRLSGLAAPRLPPADPDRGKLADLAGRYCAGQAIGSPRDLFPGARRVPLPSYPFERTRFWPGTADDPGAGDPGASKDHPDVSDADGPRPAAPEARNWLYEPIWSPVSAPPGPVAALTGNWLIVSLAATSGGTSTLAAAVAEGTGRVAEACWVNSPPGPPGGAGHELRSAADVDVMFAALAGQGMLPLAGVVVLADPVPAGPPVPLGSSPVLDIVLEFLRSLTLPRAGTPRVLVVTRDLDQAPPCAAAVAAGQLAMVLPHERPGVLASTLDLDCALDSEQAAAAILAELRPVSSQQAGSRQTRARQVARHAGGHFERDLRTIRPPGGRARFGADGAYLITGGTGGLGAELARWLIDRGARRLALLSRGSDPARDAELGQELTSLGAEVIGLHGDVSRAGDLAAATAAVRRQWGRLTGVFHLAGTRDRVSRSLWSKSGDSMRRVLGPKVSGTLALLDAVSGEDLEFVALFSSIAGLGGELAAGQADYAAANAFLDCCARWARKPGSRWVSIGWPHWAEVGMGGHERPSEVMRRRCLTALSPPDGIAVLDAIFADLDVMPSVLTVLPAGQPVTASGSPRRAAAAAPEELVADVTCLVQEFLARRLGLPAGELTQHSDLRDLGVDSLAIADLVGAVEARYATRIDPSDVVAEAQLSALCQRLAGKLADQGTAGQGQHRLALADLVRGMRDGTFSAQQAARVLLQRPLQKESASQ